MSIVKDPMKILPAIAVFGALALGPAAAEEEHRQLGAHEHGRGKLNMAVEGARLTMELEVPGMDIVGFEHAAKARQDIAAVEKGKQLLMQPLALFALPAAAGCAVTDAKVALEAEDHDAGDGKGASEHGADAHAHEGHTEFHAEYAFACASPHNLTTIEFGYFHAFAGARALDVSVVTPQGQAKYDVERANPHLDLAGMM